MEKYFDNISTNNVTKNLEYLEKFCIENAQKKTFPGLNNNNLRSKIWSILFEKLSNKECISIHEKCLESLRILSRDKVDLDNLITQTRLNLIIEMADLASTPQYSNVTLEATKLFCNLIYNSPSVQIRIVDTPCLANLVQRISIHDKTASYKMLLFDIRALFLITALNVKSRNIIRDQLNGDKQLINLLSFTADQIKNEPNDIIEVICEILKTLFNLYIHTDDSLEDQRQEYEKLIYILYKLLTMENVQLTVELQSHIVNLLTVMPSACYSSLIQVQKTTDKNDKIYENMDMSAIWELLKFLDKQLDNQDNLIENICPVVATLLKLSQSERLIRKYIRPIVLTPLKEKDVMKRPEEGSSIRGKLCKLLTSPVTEVRDLVAEFIFVLCKENVGRIIKYTGYGNAAGMFANKGLLGCNQPATNYSSDSEESDTEEYAKYKEAINPITGCYEKPKPNPLEGMTDEQKEYEAIKLVNLVNQLANEGFVRPCTIDENGKPKPLEHVLELQGLQHGLTVKESNDSE